MKTVDLNFKLIFLSIIFKLSIFRMVYPQGLDSLDLSRSEVLNNLRIFKNHEGIKYIPKPADFYPLKKGNYWEYKEYDEYGKFAYVKLYDRVTGDTIMSNGLKYYIIENIRYLKPPPPHDSQAIRNIYYKRVDDSGNVYLYNQYFKCDWINDKLNGKKGNIYKSWKYIYFDCDSTNCYGVIMDTGIDNGIMWKYICHCNYPYEPHALFFSDEYFYEGIGPVAIKQERTNDYLVGAIINGDTIGVVTSVSEKIPEIVTRLFLYQNYPNPFNPSTSIKFKLCENAIIRLTVYDILGKEINTLLYGEKASGEYIAEWDGKNSHHKNVSSGVYFYKLEIIPTNRDPPNIQVRKMILKR